MGIVPENEHLLGIEGAGVIRRLGRNTEPYCIRQRVITYRKGTFGNRVQAPVERIHLLPDDMSFEVSRHATLFRITDDLLQDASTLTCVYGISIHGLLDWAQMRKGHVRILLHVLQLCLLSIESSCAFRSWRSGYRWDKSLQACKSRGVGETLTCLRMLLMQYLDICYGRDRGEEGVPKRQLSDPRQSHIILEDNRFL